METVTTTTTIPMSLRKMSTTIIKDSSNSHTLLRMFSQCMQWMDQSQDKQRIKSMESISDNR